jgi:voltage-gated sodium channel
MNSSLRIRTEALVTSKKFEVFIVVLIVLNAITLGLESSPAVYERFGSVLIALDRIFLIVFVAELVMKLFSWRWAFFKNPWNVFDFIVVGIALMPAQGAFSVLRALRILRTLRLISTVPSLKRVVSGLLSAIPGLGSVGLIMLLIFYVAAVMATKLFGAAFPQWFGNVGESAYSLFQIMTLESWSMGIVRPVMETFPYAWLFFIPFILITTFTMLNLFIAVIVNSMQAESEEHAATRAEEGHQERLLLLKEVQTLNAEVRNLSQKIKS